MRWNKIIWLISFSILSCLPVSHVGAQGLDRFVGIPQVNFLGTTVAPWAGVGYQSLGINLNLPIPDTVLPNPARLDIHPLDLKLESSNMCIGAAGLSIQRANLLFSAWASGSIPRNVTITTDRFIQTPYQSNGSVVSWRGSRLEWWEIQGWGGYGFFNVGTLGAGVRWAKTTVGLGDPEGPFGQNASSRILDYSSDFLAKTTIPFFAFENRGSNHVFMVTYSPFVYADITVPLRLVTTVSGGTQTRYEDGIYTFKRGGNFLEGTFSYEVGGTGLPMLHLWAKGSWLRIRGTGDYELKGGRVRASNGAVTAQWSGEDSAISTFTSHLLSCGISANISF